MRTLSFTITGQHITGSAISDLVGNTKNYVQASFSFSSEWDDLLKVAIFSANSKQYPVVIEQGTCKVPNIVLTTDFFTVGVYAGADDERLTTDTCTVRVEESVRQKPPFDMLDMYKDYTDHKGIVVTETTGVHGFRVNAAGKGEYYDSVSEEWVILTGLVDVDAELSDESTNAIQNKAVAEKFDLVDTAVGLNTTHRGESINSDDGSHGVRVNQTTHKPQYYDSTTEQWFDLSGLVDVDSALSDSSENPVQNKVVKGKFDSVDAAVAANTSHRGEKATDQGGSHGLRVDSTTKKTQYYDSTAEEWKFTGGYIDVDSALSGTSENPVQNKIVKGALDAHDEKSVNDSAGVHGLRVNQTTHIPQYYDEAQGVWENVEGTGGGGSTITVDDQFSTTSHNPVENRVISTKINEIDSSITQISSAVGSNTTHRQTSARSQDGIHGFRINPSTDRVQHYDSVNDLWVDVDGLEEPGNRIEPVLAMPGSPANKQTVLFMGNTVYKFNAVSPAGTENPHTEGWYEYDSANEQYTATTDTTVTSGKMYYIKNPEYTKGKIYRYANGAWSNVPLADELGFTIKNGKICQVIEET